jgi:hypothetical protein
MASLKEEAPMGRIMNSCNKTTWNSQTSCKLYPFSLDLERYITGVLRDEFQNELPLQTGAQSSSGNTSDMSRLLLFLPVS